MSKKHKDKKSILQKELSAKEVLAVLGGSLVLFAYGYLFIYPKYTELKSSLNNLESIEAQVAEYEDKINEMPAKKEKLEILSGERDSKSTILNHDMEDGMFLIGLSKIIENLNIELIEYYIEESVPYETFYAIPTSITVRGDYRNVREVMYYLENQQNITQILDYNMETYIDESSSSSSENINSNVFEKQPLNSEKVYWLDGVDTLYHSTESCPNIKNSSNALISGSMTSANEQGKISSDTTCVASASEISSNNEVVPQETIIKSSGQVEATFKFMMYSSEEASLKLNNDNSSLWKPGKYNPFTTTTR